MRATPIAANGTVRYGRPSPGPFPVVRPVRAPEPLARMTDHGRAAPFLEAGDHRGAAEAVLREYGPQLLGYLSSILRNDADAAEVFSQFTEDLWRGLPGFRRECPVRVWAYRLAWHAAARHLRDPYRGRGRRLETHELSRIADEVRSSALLGRREARQRGIDRLRARLQPDEQTLLVLRLDRGLSWREVATVLADEGDAVDEPALRKRFERLKEKLARMAREEGLLE
ncbi:RNA polymerase, sigma-24 subunit, ECF subfamily [Anaeromyxobacter dehalogenans 2CP-1]|uniref:RNA polymerase, sigma-24 subunit, ECF subfamily n=2 Tax=Anaeromyxobacteraceae TaxID=1524215 RepID=B8J634_ANAD2|nr:RNA polymerase, sigma-24 subunit, ECF subfamily [Anaeromyxobacter dehalogenans 2CP-1]